MTIISGLYSSLRRPGAWMAATLVIAIAASVAPAKDKEGKHVDRMVSRMEKELDLSKDQAAKIRAILAKDSGSAAHRGAWKQGKDCAGCKRCGAGKSGMRGQGMGLMGGEFTAQLRAGSVDTAALNRTLAARADSMQARVRAANAERVATFAAVHAVLTPAQRAKAAEKLEKRAAEMEKKCEKKCGKSCR